MKQTIVVLLILLSILTFGCNSANEEENLLRDTAAYLKQLTPLVEIEYSVISAYRAVSGKKYRGDRIFLNTLHKEIIPKYTSFRQAINLIKVDNPVLSNLHNSYKKGVDYQLEGFKNSAEYLIRQNLELKKKSIQQLKIAEKLIGEWSREITKIRATKTSPTNS